MLNTIIFGLMALSFAGFMIYLAYDAWKGFHKRHPKG
jgi:hypothetical protein